MKSCLSFKPFVLSLSMHERQWLATDSAFPFILRQAQDEREALTCLPNNQDSNCNMPIHFYSSA